MSIGSICKFRFRLAIVVTSVLLAATTGYLARAAARRPASVKPPTPFFQFLWKEEIAEPAVRLAVADVTGDGIPRLILLAQKPLRSELATLIIKKWNGTEFTTEFTGDVTAPPDRMAVGRFAGKDKPAVIVTADALWSWNGSKYVRKPVARPLPVFGCARLHSGDERLILSDSVKEFNAYAVDSGVDSDWLVNKADAPTGTQVEWETMRAAPAYFLKMGMPTYLGGGGMITVWDISKSNSPYIFYCRPAPDLAAGVVSPKVNSFIAFRDATELAGNELWTTTRLNGLATDLALDDPRAPGKHGLLILTNSATGDKSRTIYFYGLQ